MEQAFQAGQAHVLTLVDTKGVLQHYRWLVQVPLNDSNPEVLVNFLEYWEVSNDGNFSITPGGTGARLLSLCTMRVCG
jgi:hypothetical protein